MKPATFIITRSRATNAVRLSMLGNWGNVPFASVAAAEARAREVGGAGAAIRHEVGR